jgi:hypothetical protein
MRWVEASSDADEVGLFSFFSLLLWLSLFGAAAWERGRQERLMEKGNVAPTAHLYNQNGKANRRNPKRQMNLAHLLSFFLVTA